LRLGRAPKPARMVQMARVIRWGMLAGAVSLSLCACDSRNAAPMPDRAQGSEDFPQADRPVAPTVSIRWSDEQSRDRVHEASLIMDHVGVKPGMTVADIGAGEGYYTVRLAARVGKQGRVLAEDIMPEVIEALGRRITRENLTNISVKLGTPIDPKLPAKSFDRVFMVHMYHEITEPYAFLWHLHPALKVDGEVVVVDVNKPTEHHGSSPKLLQCEFEAVGYRLISMMPQPSQDGYIARFRAIGRAPDPSDIVPCALAR
jgi:ubiquinone/menaquinone biosynthesis C-methylase UbiE